MASRDSQTVILSRQAILLVTAVGVGLLTLCYVLGVQVGKQSAALRRPMSKDAGEELEELPATMADQLKALEQTGTGSGAEKPQDPKPAPAPEAPQADAAARKAEPAAPRKPEPAPPAIARKPEPTPPAAAKKPEPEGHWTVQLISTPDGAEAKTIMAKAKAAGFTPQTVSEKGLYKVRLGSSMKREAADASIQKLRNHGFKPFPIKVD